MAEDKLAHNITAFNTQYSDTGLFGIYAVAEDKAVNDLMYAMTSEMTRLCYEVKDSAVEEAKSQAAVNLIASLEGSTAVR